MIVGICSFGSSVTGGNVAGGSEAADDVALVAGADPTEPVL
jgi:hypothetical protein